ncbi:MAG TPA: hypothetical protein PKY82_15330, partial [Pyrinomonadaceae bacterium]|nr:hypothetical protein [Pyrinomonadaceae bacterium]
KLPDFLPNGFKIIENGNADHVFNLKLKDDETFELQVWQKGLENLIFDEERRDGLILFENQLHLTIGNYAVSKVFVHAGVIGWKGMGIVFPGTGFSGKSTLIAELVKLGAIYYSDEYAVLDEDCNVHPFPRMLLLRGIESELKQTPVPIETLGGKNGIDPIPVKFVVFTEFKNNAVWKPKKLSKAEGVMNLLANTIPIRQQPQLSLNVLNKLAGQSIMIKSKRGEAQKLAKVILKFLEQE